MAVAPASLMRRADGDLPRSRLPSLSRRRICRCGRRQLSQQDKLRDDRRVCNQLEQCICINEPSIFSNGLDAHCGYVASPRVVLLRAKFTNNEVQVTPRGRSFPSSVQLTGVQFC
ncbi:hypothetical protein VPH35_059624 [Triticum aestivum]